MTTAGELYPLMANGMPNTAVAGAAGGSAICNVQYPGAHLCNPYELYESVVTAVAGDALDGTKDVGPFLVYQQAWVNGYSTGAQIASEV